jgi:hypothetical protein
MSDLASSVNFKRATERRGPRTITQVASAVLGMVGISERGPMGVATKCTSFQDWQRKFGGYTANNLDTIEPVRGFFEGGGQELHFVRTNHYTTPGDSTTKTSAPGTLVLQTASGSATAGSVTGTVVGPYALADGDTIIIDVDAGGNDTATFNATAASRTCANTGTYNLTNGWTLTFSINGGTVRTATFLTANFANIAAATAQEVVNVLNATIATYDMGGVASVDAGAVKIASNRKGTGSAVNVTGGTSNATLGFTTGSIAGTGDAVNAAAVTVAELKTLIEGDITGLTVTDVGGAVKIASNTTGGSSTIVVSASSTMDDELGIDNATHTGTTGAAVDTLTFTPEDGSYSDDITIRVSTATSGAATDFNLAFLRNGIVTDSFPNANMDTTSTRYVLTLVNDNNTLGITVADELAAVASPGNLPATGTSAAFAGGDDGLTSLADADFSGAVSGTTKTGLRVFDGVDAITLIAIPQRCTASVASAIATWCEITRAQTVFAIPDPPAGLTADQMVTYVEDTAALIGSTEMGAIYWPRVKVATPNADLYGAANVTIPPSGDIAAAYARKDNEKVVGGSFAHPAGLDVTLPRVLGLESNSVLEITTREKLFPKRINPISRELDAVGNSTPFFLDGARTLKDSGQFPHIGSSRGVQITAKSLRAGLAFARHKNNTPGLRRSCADACELYLKQVTKTQLLASVDPEDAFIVDFGPGLNPPSAKNNVNGAIGIATTEPAEFVYVEIYQDDRALEAELAAA